MTSVFSWRNSISLCLASFWMKVKEWSKKAGLKLSIQKMKIMASGPITSQQIDGETVETVNRLYFRLQNHWDGNCSLEIKMLSPWKTSSDKPREHIKKQRYHFANKSP